MDILEALKWRYATKKFDPQKNLPQEKIELLKKAFNLTPSSYGLQPLKLVVIHNQPLQDVLVEHSMNQKQISEASHVLVICIETEIDKEYINAHFEREKSLRNTPEKILEPYRNFLIDFFKKQNADFIRSWGVNQAYLALGNLLTVCAAENIDSCPMEGFVSKKYDEILQLKEKGLESVIVVPVGYRAEDDIFSEFKKVRRSIEDTTIEF